MRLLIVTQKVDENDAVLGFFHGWIAEFAKNCKSVIVICLEEGVHHLPKNVKVLSLGKEKKHSRIQYLVRFYRYIWQERNSYDAVFVHMNPIYVVLGGLLWKFLNKKIFLWYTHKSVDWKLRAAEKCVKYVFTASPESFRLSSNKVQIVGHGIDIVKFSPSNKTKNIAYTIISVGRFSPIKRQYDLVLAFKVLHDQGFLGQLVLVGGSITNADQAYENKIKEYIRVNKLEGYITCIGPVAPASVDMWYKKADMFVNLSDTGSVDKAILEAMASGLQILTSNEAFRNILPPDNFIEQEKNNTQYIAEKTMLLSRSNAPSYLREYVANYHNLTTLIPTLIHIMRQA